MGVSSDERCLCVHSAFACGLRGGLPPTYAGIPERSLRLAWHPHGMRAACLACRLFNSPRSVLPLCRGGVRHWLLLACLPGCSEMVALAGILARGVRADSVI